MTDETGGALSVQTYKLIDLYTHEMNQTKMWWTWSTKIFLRSKQSKNATTNKVNIVHSKQVHKPQIYAWPKLLL